MQDLKLICEIIHALEFGRRTTKKKELYSLYRNFDDSFLKKIRFKRYLDFAFELISELRGIHNTNLMKPYMVYSLALAVIHGRFGIKKLKPLGAGKIAGTLNKRVFQEKLLELDEALEVPDEDVEESKYKEFILASSERTNVKEQRETRFKWFLSAYRQAAKK